MFNTNVLKGIKDTDGEGSFVEIKVSDIWEKNPRGEYPMDDSPSLEEEEDTEDDLLAKEIERKKEELENLNFRIKEQETYAQSIVAEALELAENMKQEIKNSEHRMVIDRQKFEVEQETLRKELLDEIEVLKQEALEQAEREKQALLKEVEPEVARIIKDLVGYLVSEEIYTSTEWIKSFVRKTMFNENLEQNIKLIVSPHNLRSLNQEGIEDLSQFRYNVDIVQDNRLADDVCFIETNKGTIEYNITKGLEQILKEIDMLVQFKK